MELEGKNVVYVGGFGGIGIATLRLLVQKKVANLFVLDVAENKVFLDELKSLNNVTNVFFEPLNLLQKDKIAEVFKIIISKINHFDILVNGSGIINDNKIEQTIGINLLGLIYTTLVAIPYMDKSKGGRGGLIANIASVVGLQPISCLSVYSASKHGVMGFSRGIADEYYYNKTGVAVMTICPGITTTGLWHEFEGNGTFDYSEELSKKFYSAKNQRADECAVNFVKALETGKNDSIWILDLGKLEEVNPHKYWSTSYD